MRKDTCTSKAERISPGCEKLEKLHPRGPTRPVLLPRGHPDPTEADTGQDCIITEEFYDEIQFRQETTPVASRTRRKDETI